MDTQNTSKEETQMKTYQVTDLSTGEVFDIEAVSAVVAGEAFRKEGRSVKIKPQRVEEQPQDTASNKEAQMSNLKQSDIQEWFVTGSRGVIHFNSDVQTFVNAPRSTWRVITNDLDFWFGEQIRTNKMTVEPVDKGSYNPAFLNKIFGSKAFVVEVAPLKDVNGGMADGYFKPSFTAGTEITKHLPATPDGYVFGWADLNSETIIRCEDKDFTLQNAGVVIGNSAKAPKRFTEIVRFARGTTVNEGIKIKKLVISKTDLHQVFPYLTEQQLTTGFDGVSIVSKWLVKQSYINNPLMQGKDLGRMLAQVDNGQQTNWTIRCVTNINGQPCMIKGNAIVMQDRLATHKRLWTMGLVPNGEFVDIITFEDNVKKELGTDGSFETLTFEPHHGTSYVRTNDLMLAQYFGIKGLMDPQELLSAWKSFLAEAVESLREGKDISWMVDMTSTNHNTELERIVSTNRNKNTVSVLNDQISTLHDLGLTIGVSQSIMNMRANGVLLSNIGQSHIHEGKKFNMDSSFEGVDIFEHFNNWTTRSNEKKANMVMPHAYRAYVMTFEVLYLAGYDIDLDQEFGFYHDETQTFAVSSEVWTDLAPTLGGADLDDEIMIFERLVKDLEGSIMIKAFILRSPNDWAEYGFVNIDGPSGQARIAYNDMPILDMADLERFKVKPQTGNLPSVDGIVSNPAFVRPMPKVYDDTCIEYMWRTAFSIKLGVGGQVKNKMIHYATYGAFETLPCPNEQMIDALQAPTGTIDDMNVLQDWQEQSMIDIICGGVQMDAYWWESRSIASTVKNLVQSEEIPAESVTQPLDPKDSPIVRDLMIPRQMIVVDAWQKMIEVVNSQIVEIQELQDIFDSKHEETIFVKRVDDKAKEFKNGNSQQVAETVLANALKSHKAAVDSGEQEKLNQFYLYLLKMARASYVLKKRYIDKGYHSTANFDQWLYYSVKQDGRTMVDLFAEALAWFRTTK